MCAKPEITDLMPLLHDLIIDLDLVWEPNPLYPPATNPRTRRPAYAWAGAVTHHGILENA